MAPIFEDPIINNTLDIKGGISLQTVEDESDPEESRHVYNQTDTKTLNSSSHLQNDIISSVPGPVCGNVNVSSSENVHIGNETHIHGNVTIKQIIHAKAGIDNAAVKTEDEKPKNLGFKSSKLAFGVEIRIWHALVFIAAIIIVIGSIFACIFALGYTKDDKNSNNSIENSYYSEDHYVTSPDYLRIVSRGDWLAQPPTDELLKLKLPAPLVIISHTAAQGCDIQSQCVLRVRNVQMFHIESKGWSDIGYNFLVGGDGSAYIGRGWDYVGAHTFGYNNISIGIAFIGTFSTIKPPKRQIDACLKLIRYGVELGKIDKDYKLLAHSQVMPTESPGRELLKLMPVWPHFYKLANDTDIRQLLPKYL